MSATLMRLSALYFLLFSTSVFCASLDSDLLSGMKARAIGPAAVGGRITSIDVVESNPNHMVIGVATGGVWVTENGGLTWTPVFDDQPVASIGSVKINQSNPDIIWVGTGEGNTRNSTSIGGGVYKSVDGGDSWKFMGLPESERIHRMALDPDNADIVYVAALGKLWGSSEQRGIYKTIDGGETWDRVLYVNDQTGATDIKMDPNNPRKLIAGMWQFRRWPYQFKSGGPGSGMYISHDSGQTWELKTQEDGLPEGELGRMEISFSRAKPGRIFALIEAKKSALIRSDDGGSSWQKVNEEHNVAERPFYYTEIVADPVNADRIYNIATRLRVSVDGGKTFTYNEVINCCAPGNTIHIDNHAFWINPSDPKHLVIGNDGGIAISRDQGATWRFVRNLPLAQFYHIRVDNEHPYNIYGGLQDNGSWRGPSEVWIPSGIRNLHWQEVGFGDGFDTVPDPENAQAGYAMSQGGFLFRYDLDKGLQYLIRPAPPAPETDLRFNWDAGFAIDPFDPATLYYGSQFIHKSIDRGQSWSVISDDLTSNDPEMQTFRTSGGLTSDVTAAENYTSITVVSPSQIKQGVIWVGSDDGRVHVTTDGGQNWERIDQRAKAGEPGAWVPMITPSAHDAETAFVVFDDHRRSDMNPYVYRVSNLGKTWKLLNMDDLSGYALSVLQDPVDPGLLFVGTEFGLYFSTDSGENFTRFTAGLPTVSVMDMAIQQRETDLVLGTHGRSVYVIDDFSALRGLSPGVLNEKLKILSSTTGQHYGENPTSSTRFTGSGEFRGENEEYGVVVTFVANGEDLMHPDSRQERQRKINQRQSTGEAAAEAEESKPVKATVSVKNSRGELIRTFTQPVYQGINRTVWNMRVDGVRPAPGPTPPEPGKDLPSGPEVAPGDYTLTIKLHEQEDSTVISTAGDPRLTVSQAEMEQKFSAMMELQAKQDVMVSALEQIDRVRNDIKVVKDLKAHQASDEAGKDLDEHLESAEKALDELENVWRVPPKTRGIVYDDDKVSAQLGMAQYYVLASPGAPSETAITYMQAADRAVTAAMEETNRFMTNELVKLRESINSHGVGLLVEPAALKTP